jgi:hypothetical protein
MKHCISAALILSWALAARGAGPADYRAWAQSGSLFVRTTPDGANAPAQAVERGFPLLVRLHKDFFDFAKARADGADVRFATSAGEPLAFQVEAWDAAAGVASVWVRLPEIRGNARQEIKVYWGNPAAASESNGKAVFDASNGYLAVWHMTGPVTDETGTLTSKDMGTADAAGVIGAARHFPGKAGIFGGDKIANYPSGAGSHSTQAWFRAERPNVTIIGWGNEEGGRGGKVRMLLRSPAHVRIDSNFSDVKSEGALALGEWTHVVHTYDKADGRIYINGKLDGSAKPMLNFRTPAKLWLGGWYNNYDFVGDLDEVRISSVARSADWVRLEYENQKPLQTLVGPIVRAGDAFSVSPAKVVVAEGQRAVVSAEAGGAEKTYWVLKRGGAETVVAVDRSSYAFDAGRVIGDEAVALVFKAVYADRVRTAEVPITVREAIPEPVFTLRAPANWDGRARIEVVPEISNSAAMRAAGAGDVRVAWTAGEIAVIKEAAADKLVLTRAQNSGKLTVTASVDNGGKAVVRTAEIVVEEPATDPWVARVAAKDERPRDNQFYARDDSGEGTLIWNGAVEGRADSAFLRVYADDRLYKDEGQKLTKDGVYSFAIKLKPGLVRYKAEMGTITGGVEKVIETASNLVCGDAFVINGQSNALATDWGKEEYTFTSPWIRTFGNPGSGAKEARSEEWGDAEARGKGGRLTIGCWGIEMAKRLVENQKVPVCIINGAVGGTRIDQHQRNEADPEDVTTIYGRLLWRVRRAGLTHGVRAILWHQGENDQGADGPTGGYGYELYRSFFIEMAAGWRRDFTNVK